MADVNSWNLSQEALKEALEFARVEESAVVSAERLPDGRPVLQIELDSGNDAVKLIVAFTLRLNREFGWAWAMAFADRGEINELHLGCVLLQYIDVELGY